MEEPILDYVSRGLNEHKGQWPAIARDTGVDYSTICKIAQGVRANPTIANLQPLMDWLRARDAMLEQVRRKTAV